MEGMDVRSRWRRNVNKSVDKLLDLSFSLFSCLTLNVAEKHVLSAAKVKLFKSCFNDSKMHFYDYCETVIGDRLISSFVPQNT